MSNQTFKIIAQTFETFSDGMDLLRSRIEELEISLKDVKNSVEWIIDETGIEGDKK